MSLERMAHAFSRLDIPAALAWRRLAAGPVVFTCPEAPERASLADRRLQLGLLENAIRNSDAVVAPTREVQEAMARWLAVDAPLLEPGDAAAQLRLYHELGARAGAQT